MFRGDRTEKFYNLIHSLFVKAQLEPEFIKLCLVPKNMKKFSNAFTSASYDKENNYEYYEQIGDSTVNKFIVSYMYSRFPQLKSSDGVNIVARLKIKYGSKGQLNMIGESLNFWPFISTDPEERIKRKKNLLEDVFEAFFGCFEEVLNDTIHEIKNQYYQVGYDICYTLLSKIFDELYISIEYEALVDSKTRLKELFDEQRQRLQNLKYKDSYCFETNMFISQAFNNKKLLGTGMSHKKKEARERAADKALATLAEQGVVKDVPQQYKNLVQPY